MAEEGHTQRQGKRVGANPILVIFGVIIGLWLFISLIIPHSKDRQAQPGTSSQQPIAVTSTELSDDLVPTFEVSATVPDMNAINLLVPPKTTDSQILALLNHLRQARLKGTLSRILPPTTPGHELGNFAIADIYIFSEKDFAGPEAAKALGRGAHAPGEFYPSSIPFEVAMEHVRGHYAIDLHNRASPETASLGFGEPTTGVYSKEYRGVEF